MTATLTKENFRMEMTLEEVSGITRVGLAGKMDARGAESIDLKFTASVSKRDKVAIDLSAVDYIASIGIRIFVMAAKAAARRHQKLVIFGANECVQKVIVTTGLSELVPVLNDWASAQAALT